MSVFIAQLFPKDKVKDINGASQAGINFCHSFIDAVNPQVVYAYQINSEKVKLKLSFNNNKINYICIRLFPHIGLGKIINTIIENSIILLKIFFTKKNNIWIYNLTPQVYFLYFGLKFILRKKVFIILADMTPELKRTKIALRLIYKADGIISLTPEFKPLFRDQNKILIKAGIVEDSILPNPNNQKINRTVFLFSGNLRESTGVYLVLETFSKLPSLQLWITGTGNCLSTILKYQNEYANIKYLGYLDMDSYYNILRSVDFVFSLRDEKFAENMYNFPSKIIEFFYHKKIVISTKRYTTLKDSVYFFCDYDTYSLSNKINSIIHLEESVLKDLQEEAHQFAINNFSKKSWSLAVKQLESKS